MKKYLVISIAALSILGCRNFEEAPIQSESSGQSESGDEYVILATIEQDSTRTTLADNGYTVNWSDGDEISVYYSFSQVRAQKTPKTTYKLSTFKLSSDAGSTDGTFKSESKISAYSDGAAFAPKFAFFPANKNLSVSTSDVTKFSNNNLPNILELNGPRDISKGDIKAAATFSDNSATAKASYSNSDLYFNTSCVFKELGVLLDFVITPTSDMINDGDVIQSISMTAGTHKLAGSYDFLYNGKDNFSIDCPNEIEPSNKTMTVTYKNGTAPVITSAAPVELLMTVLPGVQEDEALTITILTNNRSITVTAKAAQTFESGYKYKMSLPLASIPSGHITVVLPDKFTKITDKLGKFTCDDQGEWTSVFSDDDQNMQYGYFNNVCRFQDWESGSISFLTFPSGTFSAGNEFTLKEKTLTSSETSVTVSVAKKEGNIYWLKSADGNTGYILSKED